MTGKHDKLLIHFAEGRGENLGKAKPKVAGWGDFCKQFSKPTKTKERRSQYDKLNKDQQVELKAVDGWIIGAQVAEGRRTRQNIRPRDLASLDYDYATVEFVIQIELGATPISRYEFFIHSSRRHTDEKPRLRFYAPLSRPVAPEEYVPFSRILALFIERANPMPMVDQVSFRVAQMMFKPTTSIDGDWFCYRNEGEIIDPDFLFAWFEENYGDWRNLENLPRAAGENKLRATAEKAEDPTTKKGPVGDFCRAYDVEAAIETFLSDKYKRVDEFSSKPRYSYLGGTTTSGAVVEDGGLFLYSHHGSDPVADRLVNAFDLCRIHLYGELDEDADEDAPPTKTPSYKAFLEFIREDPGYRKSQTESRYDMAAMFDDVVEELLEDEQDENKTAEGETPESPEVDLLGLDDDDDILGIPASATSFRGPGSPVAAAKPRPAKRPKAPNPETWFPSALEVDQNGRILSTMPNAAVIIHNDARFHGAIAFNDFTKQIVARYSILSRLDIAPPFICRNTTNGDRWQEFNDITLRMILEAPNGEGKGGYGMSMTDRNMNGAVVSAALRNRWHPVREWLDSLTWDGIPRIDTLFSRFLGCPDTPYHREAARWTLVASVARIFEPGHKFDYAPILQGETGILKSTFIKALYSEEWFGEIRCKLDNIQQVAEVMAGMWGGELAELAGFHKSDFNAAKAFMRAQIDKVRMAYDRRVSEFPRQCVIWGTTNDTKYLRDPTGNRSYWPIIVGVPVIDIAGVMAERPQLWAEAVAIYREMRKAQPRGTLPLTLSSREAIDEAKDLQEQARSQEMHEMWAERLTDWADAPLTLAQLMNEFDVPPEQKFRSMEGPSADEIMVQRIAFTREQAVLYGLKKDRGVADYQTAQNIEKALPLIEGWHQLRDASTGRGGQRLRVFGQQKRYWIRQDATLAELKQGYRIAGPAVAGRDEDDDFSDIL